MKMVKLILCVLLFAGCGNPESGANAAGPSVETKPPAALENAKLVFQRPEGVFLQRVGREPELLVEGGSWPRWSADGSFVAFVRGNRIGRILLESGRVEFLADAGDPNAVAVPPGGEEIWFTDGDAVKAVSTLDRTVRTLAEGPRFLEIDAGPEGRRLVATVKHLGYRIRTYDVVAGSSDTLAKGCSASFSPDGTTVTNNLDGHTRLALLDAGSGASGGVVPAPSGIKTDNQFWSNHPDWIVSMAEESGNVLAHRVSDGRVWRLYGGGGADRPDMYVP